MESILRELSTSRREDAPFPTTTAGVTMMSSVVLVDGEEQAADQFDDDDEVRRALKQLAQALEAVLPILRAAESGVAINVDDDRANKEGGKESEHDEFVSSTPPAPSSSSAPPPPAAVVVSAAWLLQICQSYYQTSSSSEDLEPSVVAHAIVSAATQYRNDPVAQQSALFDALGASDAAMNLLSEVAPHLHQIAASIQIQDLETVQAVNIATAPVDTVVDLAEERRALLRQEAWDAASVAAAARAEADEILARSSSVAATATSSSSTGSHANGTTATHTLLRASDRQALKRADKAAQKAAKALQRAKDAGAILDESDLLNMDGAVGRGSGGLQHRSHEELAAIQAALLPEGSRQYYDDHGLPRGTIRETDSDGTQRAIIPPATTLEAGLQHPRLRVVDVIDPSLAPAFAGTSTLNPLQSAVYEAAHHSRENLLVCAPTGAGKTNVALLAATAHFRDVGLVPTSSSNPDDRGPIDAGTKVVYIAPMKALAQEVVDKFTDKLRPLGLVVRELTGDVQLSRAEAAAANVLVTTPEKWDVVTRKSGTDETSLGAQCGLLIIDEVHLLADERGAVIESVVARVHRFVEVRQRQVRIVALSATLPNYDDVAEFLQVPDRGIFFFGPEHRPVPLEQRFIGVNANSRDRALKEQRFDDACFDEVLHSLRRGYQVMVFVHSRKGTGDTARALADRAREEGLLERHFSTQGKDGPVGDAHKRYADKVHKSRNREVQAHFANGIGIHHAGMLRGDRKLVERMFADGAIRVLCCTATLAWGVNLPAHSIVIKGTDVYNPEKGGNVDLSILDVQQIFGRAGRPQFDDSGEATLITTADAFPRYMDKLVRAVPIESNFTKQLADHLNAEIAGGSVDNVREAARWLTYTYLYVRMLRNPLAYGISHDKKIDDPRLLGHCTTLVVSAAKRLHQIKMIRFDQDSGNLAAIETGRIAAQYYIQAESISTFVDMLRRHSVTDSYLLEMVSSASEFEQMKLRQEELKELEELVANDNITPLKIRGAGMDDAGHSLITDSRDKVFVLIQAFVSRANIKSFTLVSDVNYIAANAGRVARALFEMCLKMKPSKAGPALKLLRIAKSIDNRLWWFQTPLRHFDQELRPSVLSAIELRSSTNDSYDAFATLLSFLDMHPKEVGQLCRANKDGAKVQGFIRLLPKLTIDCKLLPITADVARFVVEITPAFRWNGRYHGGAQTFWFWIESTDNSEILHREPVLFTRRTSTETMVLDVAVPLFGMQSARFVVRIISDSWVGVEEHLPVNYVNLRASRQKEIVTELQDLTPLPITALQDQMYQQLYKFRSFNPIQTQLFHVLYHTDCPVLLGAPTGSGKTIVAEVAILRMKRLYPRGVCVYIAPLKALARERLKEWRHKFGKPPLKWSILELSGDTHYDKRLIERADILVCTPEKWDLISRGLRVMEEAFQDDASVSSLKILQNVKLLVLDEIHLLGEDRGAVLEALVSRTRYISKFLSPHNEASAAEHPNESTRIIGLSTALANAVDLAEWIGIKQSPNGTQRGLYNFRNTVRPVPLSVHSQGFSGRHYCPRMATMNKPCMAAIKEHSPSKPVLIFVASRRQTRLTAFDLISYVAAEDDPKRFLKCSEVKIEAVSDNVRDEALRHTLLYGIGLHHAGLCTSDREVVEELYLKGDIQILVATATLAWGVNLPAHLVIVKGTEFFDGKTSRYVDYPLTDVLQMVGRAGRPGFDTSAVAIVMCTEEMKTFYQKSCLEKRICENMNAEIVSGTVSSLIDATGYLGWTFYARRVRANPAYYGASSSSDEDVEQFLMSVAGDALKELKSSGCIKYDEEADDTVQPLPLGMACSGYYLSHRTPKQMEFGARAARKLISQALDQERGGCDGPGTFLSHLKRSHRVDEVAAAWIFYTLCSTHEFDEHPVRHNEEFLNESLSEELKWGPDTSALLSNQDVHHNPEIFQDPHTKCFLLVQAYLEGSPLPISDYVNDMKTVIENMPRLLAALQFIARQQERGAQGSFELMTQVTRTRQLLVSKSTVDSDPLLQLHHFTNDMLQRLLSGVHKKQHDVDSLYALRSKTRKEASSVLRRIHKENRAIDPVVNALFGLPWVRINDCRVQHFPNETSGKSTGKVHLQIEIERNRPTAVDSSSTMPPLTLTLILGTWNQRVLLADKSIGVRLGAEFVKNVDLDFDWTVASANGGEHSKKLILRILWEEIRGLDSEMIVKLP